VNDAAANIENPQVNGWPQWNVNDLEMQDENEDQE